jgi:6-phospho-beta-glucosidase
MSRTFPKDFLWGSSTNAQQFEGGRSEGDTGVSIADVRSIPAGPESSFDKFKVAADHYHHLDEDIDLYGEMGFQIYRFSLSWTRIFPNGNDDKPNQAGLDFYDHMLAKLEQYGIKPVCTLYAYDLPQHLIDEYGGFLDRRIIDDYARYVQTVVSHFKGRIAYYVPFNETNCIWLDKEYMTGNHPENDTQLLTMMHNITMCYARAVETVHALDKGAKVGSNIANNISYPASPNPADVEECERMRYFFGWGYADVANRGYYPKYFLNRFEVDDVDAIITPEDKAYMSRVIKPDFQSLTYYFTTVIGAGEDGKNAMSVGHPNPYVPATEWGWSIDPYGYYSMLMEYWHRYQLPILILENGLGHRDELAADGHVHDQNRIAYLRAHIERMGQAIDDGVQMEGYCTWSATDLYSTRNGFGKRYGFVYVDQDHDFRRIRKDSFFWYKKVIATNGADLSD